MRKLTSVSALLLVFASSYAAADTAMFTNDCANHQNKYVVVRLGPDNVTSQTQLYTLHEGDSISVQVPGGAAYIENCGTIPMLAQHSWIPVKP